MSEFDWRRFLQEFSAELLGDEEIIESLPAEVGASGWLGFPGATQEELSGLESRLGVTLSPSYRAFLATSNGWRTTGWSAIVLWPVDKIAWLRDVDPGVIDAWTSTYNLAIPDEEYFVYGDDQQSHMIRTEYLRDMLAISSNDWANQDRILLTPRVIFDNGEWEAWHLSSEYPGATRVRSFRELMEQERRLESWSREFRT